MMIEWPETIFQAIFIQRENMDNDKEQIKARAEERGIEWLVHFTHIKNLESILKHGIIPRLQTEQLNESSKGEFIFPDRYRTDGKNASCLSIMFPNNKMLWHKRKEYSDEYWVFLLLRPDILWECDCAFYPTNAASTGLHYQPVEKFKTASAFEAMFADTVIRETRFEIENISRSVDLKAYLPTDVQAEVLVFNNISTNYIFECYFHWKLGDVASKLKDDYPDFAFFPNEEWVKKNTKHIFYGFRENVNWR